MVLTWRPPLDGRGASSSAAKTDGDVDDLRRRSSTVAREAPFRRRTASGSR